MKLNSAFKTTITSINHRKCSTEAVVSIVVCYLLLIIFFREIVYRIRDNIFTCVCDVNMLLSYKYSCGQFDRVICEQTTAYEQQIVF